MSVTLQEAGVEVEETKCLTWIIQTIYREKIHQMITQVTNLVVAMIHQTDGQNPQQA